MMTSSTRRGFLGCGLAACGGYFLPREVFAADGRPLMTFGVVSDVHIGGRKETPQLLEGVLKWLNVHGADAVLVPGDIAHVGRIDEMEQFASVWHKVFPGGRGHDARRVELMTITGNHDAGDAFWRWANERQQKKMRLTYGQNPHAVYERLFGEKWELVWRREVKGITFVGSQWPELNPQLETFMAGQRGKIDPAKPFFFIQHEHPRNTCHGAYGCGWDKGQSVRALSPFPNAVAFTGHSHCSIADERAVWQGAFTSIGAGCLHEGGLQFGYDNCSAFWHPSFKKNLMAPLNDAVAAWGGDPDGGCFEFVEVYADHIIVHRRSSVYDAAIGPAWVVPIPAKPNGAYDFKKRATASVAPQFASDAQLTVEVCPKGCDGQSKARKGEPCVRVVIPNAGAEKRGRVFTYHITVVAGGKVVAKGKVFAAGFSLPETQMDRATEYLVSLKDLPSGETVVFTVTPRNCFEKSGRPLSASVKV